MNCVQSLQVQNFLVPKHNTTKFRQCYKQCAVALNLNINGLVAFVNLLDSSLRKATPVCMIEDGEWAPYHFG
jgi:hypothetical protein